MDLLDPSTKGTSITLSIFPSISSKSRVCDLEPKEFLLIAFVVPPLGVFFEAFWLSKVEPFTLTSRSPARGSRLGCFFFTGKPYKKESKTKYGIIAHQMCSFFLTFVTQQTCLKILAFDGQSHPHLFFTTKTYPHFDIGGFVPSQMEIHLGCLLSSGSFFCPTFVDLLVRIVGIPSSNRSTVLHFQNDGTIRIRQRI